MRYLKHFIFVIFTLFALLPCKIKQTVSHIFSIEFTKPLHGAKTQLPASNCSYYSVENQVEVQQEKEKDVVVSEPTSERIVPTLNSSFPKTYNIQNNSPPIYILYKQLKLNYLS